MDILKVTSLGEFIETVSAFRADWQVPADQELWFRARGEISAAVVEGFNNKAKLTTRKAYGFRSFGCIEIALYHTLGQLPEPDATHRFC